MLDEVPGISCSLQEKSLELSQSMIKSRSSRFMQDKFSYSEVLLKLIIPILFG